MNAPSRSPSAADAPPSAHAKFVHLKVHSAYSLLEGALPIPKLAKLAAAHELPALGLTDTNNLFGALEFSDKLADAGIQPIIGVRSERRFRGAQAGADRAAAQPRRAPRGRRADRAACDERGRLRQHDEAREPGASRSRRRPMRRTPRSDALAAHAEGLIALTGGPDGPIDRALRDGQQPLAEERLKRARRRHSATGSTSRSSATASRASTTSSRSSCSSPTRSRIPIVATNEAYFASARRLRGARRAAVHRGRPLRRRGRSPPA